MEDAVLPTAGSWFMGCFENDGSSAVPVGAPDVGFTCCRELAARQGAIYFGMEQTSAQLGTNQGQCTIFKDESVIWEMPVTGEGPDIWGLSESGLTDCEADRPDENGMRLGRPGRMAVYWVRPSRSTILCKIKGARRLARNSSCPIDNAFSFVWVGDWHRCRPV